MSASKWEECRAEDRFKMYETCLIPLWFFLNVIRLIQMVFTMKIDSIQFLPMCLGLVLPKTYSYLSTHGYKRLKRYLTIAVTEIFYLMNVYIASNLSKDQFPMMCTASTFYYIVMIHQWYQSSWISALMSFRHFFIWYLGFVVVFQPESGFQGFIQYPAVFIAVLVSIGVWMRQQIALGASFDLFQSRELAEEQRNFIESILEAVPSGVLVLDQQLSLNKYNENAVRFLDATIDSTLLRTNKLLEALKTLVLDSHEDFLFDRAAHFLHQDNDVTSIKFGQTVVLDRILLWQGKKFIWKKEKSLLLVCSDVTELVQMEQSSRKESESKTHLLKSVSHELKTPLNAMINLSEDMQITESLSSVGQEKASVVVNSGHLLLHMINDLLDYTQSFTGELTVEKCRFNLMSLLQNAVDLVRVQGQRKGLTVTLRVGNLPHSVFSDQNRLSQLLIGLLKFMCK